MIVMIPVFDWPELLGRQPLAGGLERPQGLGKAEIPVRPHPTLTGYYEAPADREGYVRRLFDNSAEHYDAANRIFSLGSGRWYRRRVVRALPLAANARVLDVAVGSGLIAREIEAALGPRGLVVGLDASFGMLTAARKALRAPLLQGRAEALPIADASVDVLTLGYALRHMADLGATFAEFRRVLRPGGHLLILEIGRPRGRLAHAMAKLWFARLVPALSAVVLPRDKVAPLMRYYWETIVQCVPADAILGELRDAGFRDVELRTSLGVFREFHARR